MNQTDMPIKVKCPNCQEDNSLVTPEQKCNGKACGYRFKAFANKDDAHKYSEEQPSIAPHHTTMSNGYHIVAYCYEEIKRPSINQLSQLIQPEILSNLLRGFGKILEVPLHIYERKGENSSEIEELEVDGLLDFYDSFCKKIQEVEDGGNECNQCNVKNVQQMFSNNTKTSEFHYCWLGRRKKFAPIIINKGLLLIEWVKMMGKIHRTRYTTVFFACFNV